MRRGAVLVVVLGLRALAGAPAAAQVETQAALSETWALAFAYGAGSPDLTNVAAIDLESHWPDVRRFLSLGVASPGGHALLGAWINWKTKPRRTDQAAGAFIGLGPTLEMGKAETRLAAAARAGAELLISPGLRLRVEVRGFVFSSCDCAGRGAGLGLVGFRAGGAG